MTRTVSARSPVFVPSSTEGFHAGYLRGDSRATAFLPRHPARESDWEARIGEAVRCPPAPEVWRRALEEGRRLGADERSLEGCRALAQGEAICVTTGQQPGLFLGPLYTVYKAMTAVVLAARVEERSGRRTVPVFWLAADDSDFGEAGSACFAEADYRLTRHALEGGDLAAGGMVGDLGTEGTARVLHAARAGWAHHPSADAVSRRIEDAIARAADHGQLAAAMLHGLFRGRGLAVVDARWPELRRAAAPLFELYAGRREEVSRRVVESGRALAEAGYRARIPDASTESALFDIESRRRLPFEGTPGELLARIRERPETLSPNVMLRPLVQDSLFPNVATVAGPGEIDYHAQLASEYALLSVAMPILFPRFEATLVPPGVYRLAERRGAPVEEFVRDFDGAMRRTADRALPEGLRAAMARLEEAWREESGRVGREAESFDASLASAAHDASRRALAAIEKLREKAAQAARAAESRDDPAIKAYREFLRPRGLPQERVLSSLTLSLESEEHPLDCLAEALEKHVAAARASRPVHWLLELGGRRGGTAP
jgi:bacillithiol biosynthesis cysteine-adding enzyme BshC